MLNLVNIPAKNVVGFKIHGHVTKPDIEKVRQELIAKTRDHGLVNVYAEILRVDSESLPAMVADFKTGMEHGAHIDKMAVVTDSAYRKGEAKIRGLLSGTEVHTYDTNEKRAAMAWIQSS